jgi:hypothetical protein
MPGPTGGDRKLGRDVERTSRRRWLGGLARPSASTRTAAEPCNPADRSHLGSTPPVLVWLAVAAAVVAGVWVWLHAWLLVGVGRGVRSYLDGWAIDVEHGFGLVERAKIAVAFASPSCRLAWSYRCSGQSPLRSWPCWVDGGEGGGSIGADPSEGDAADRRYTTRWRWLG